MKNVLFVCLLAISVNSFAQNQVDLKLWYNKPGDNIWENALPVGNGFQGAMVYGNVDTETIQGAFYTTKYPNTFKMAGYSEADINAKVDKAYHDLFEGPDKVYFEVGDSMAYVSDLKNHDARTEGLSYGMMIAVQLNKKEVFDRIWRWTKKYLQHQSGPREGYFAWSINPNTMKQNSPGTASDGELYFG